MAKKKDEAVREPLRIIDLETGVEEHIKTPVSKEIPTDSAGIMRHVETEAIGVEQRRRALAQYYKKEPQVSVIISPMYEPYFGKTMTVGINGIAVCIPCDGRPYEVPRSHAAEAKARISKVDNMLTRAKRMQAFQDNKEDTPGSLKFF